MRVLYGEPVSGLDTPGLVRGLSTTMGVSISHVAIINLSNVPRLIDTRRRNRDRKPGRVPYTCRWLPVPDPRGLLHLDGARTAAYLMDGDPDSDRRDQAVRRVLRAIAGEALAPTSVWQLQATGRAIAATATDLTDADVLGLLWMRLDDRQLTQCALPEHQTIDSAQGHAVVAAFLTPDRGEPVSGCRVQAAAPASFVPPEVLLVLFQDHGAWMFVVLAAAAMLTSLGTAALFARIRSGAATAARFFRSVRRRPVRR